MAAPMGRGVATQGDSGGYRKRTKEEWAEYNAQKAKLEAENQKIQAENQKGLVALLSKDNVQGRFKTMLPTFFAPARMVRLSLQATDKSPKLLLCAPKTLLGAFLSCSALGLEPNTMMQHAHLIPFRNTKLNRYEVQLIIGYRGYIELARRTGQMRSIHADVVREHDKFDVGYGTNMRLDHVLNVDQDRGEPIAAYCHVNLVDGQAFSVMPWRDIIRVRDNSPNYRDANDKANTIWGQHLDRMARKTPIRNLFSGGEVPLSMELHHAGRLDEAPRTDFARIEGASDQEIKEGLGDFAGWEDAEVLDGGGDDEGEQVDADGVVTEKKGKEKQADRKGSQEKQGDGMSPKEIGEQFARAEPTELPLDDDGDQTFKRNR